MKVTHRWDYEHPTCLWEQWPWWFRWPFAVAVSLYLGGGAVAFAVAMLRIQARLP